MSKKEIGFLSVILIALVVDSIVRIKNPVVSEYRAVCDSLSKRVDTRLDYVEKRIFCDIVPFLTNDFSVSSVSSSSNIVRDSVVNISPVVTNSYPVEYINSYYRAGSISFRGVDSDYFVLDGIRYGKKIYNRFFRGEQIIDVFPDCFSTERCFYVCQNLTTNSFHTTR